MFSAFVDLEKAFDRVPRDVVWWTLRKLGVQKWLVKTVQSMHCVKSVHIRSFSGSYFPAFGLNTERSRVSPRIQSECGKIRTRKTLNTDSFHVVMYTNAGSRVRVMTSWSSNDYIKAQSVLRVTLLIIVLELLSREIRSGCPEEL